MSSILIHDLALNELDEAMNYYEGIGPSLGVRLLNEFNDAVVFIEKEPELFQKRFKQFRQVKLKKFPYYVVYRIENDIVAVYRFFHVKRKPLKRIKNDL